MAGGYPNRGALGIPIGQRGADTDPAHDGSGAVPTHGRPDPPTPVRGELPSVPPRRLPFVFVGPDGAPGLVVEQRRAETGWQVLVALLEPQSDGGRSLSVRWFEASRLTPAVAT